MFSDLKKVFSASLMTVGVFLLPLCSRADSDFHPTNDGGNFGLGVEVGDPGNWGIAGKIWVDSVNAFAPAVKFNDGGPAILQLDYLWHNFDIIRLDHGEMPFYIGLGGDLLLSDTVQIAGRIPLGISYIFDKRNFPVDLYFQIVPTFWFFDSGVTLDWYPEAGAHLYL